MNKIILLIVAISMHSCGYFDDGYFHPNPEYNELVITEPGIAEFGVRKYTSFQQDCLTVKNLGIEDISLLDIILIEFKNEEQTWSNVEHIFLLDILPQFSTSDKTTVDTIKINNQLTILLPEINYDISDAPNISIKILHINKRTHELSGYYKGEVCLTRSDSLIQVITSIQGTIDYFGTVHLMLTNEDIASTLSGQFSDSKNLFIGELMGGSKTNLWSIKEEYAFKKEELVLVDSVITPSSSFDSIYSISLNLSKIK